MLSAECRRRELIGRELIGRMLAELRLLLRYDSSSCSITSPGSLRTASRSSARLPGAVADACKPLGGFVDELKSVSSMAKGKKKFLSVIHVDINGELRFIQLLGNMCGHISIEDNLYRENLHYANFLE